MKSFIGVFDDVVTRTALIDRLYYLVNHEGYTCGTDSFIPLAEVQDGFAYTGEIDYIIKELARQIWLDKLAFLLHGHKKKTVGFEVWVNSLPDVALNCSELAGGNGGLNYHLDKDEYAFNNRGELYLPIFATALYLGPKEGINGGELMINVRGMDHHKEYKGGLIDLEDRKSWMEIPFRYNRMAVFDSSFPHFVKPVIAHPTNCKRLTIAINVWDRKLG
jgi:hypothetical protein